CAPVTLPITSPSMRLAGCLVYQDSVSSVSARRAILSSPAHSRTMWPTSLTRRDAPSRHRRPETPVNARPTDEAQPRSSMLARATTLLELIATQPSGIGVRD